MPEENGVHVTLEVCRLQQELQNLKIKNVECRMDGIEGSIAEVRDLQTKILYAIIGLFGASILTLIGVLAGRAIDFGVFFH